MLNIYRLYNYRPLASRSGKYSFLFEDDESHSLIVSDLSILDKGEYSVSITNKYGKAESMVKVKSGSQISLICWVYTRSFIDELLVD